MPCSIQITRRFPVMGEKRPRILILGGDAAEAWPDNPAWMREFKKLVRERTSA